MSTTLIHYQGEPVACTGGRRAYLTRELLLRADSDPDRRFVLAMCLFALDVARGRRAGPYSDHAAEAFARDRLLPAHLFAEAARCADDELAHAFSVPAAQIRQRRSELGPGRHALRRARASRNRVC